MKEVNQKEKFEPAVLLGRIGGAARTNRKAEAARENGKKGGRPKKKTKIPSEIQPEDKASS